MLLVLPPSLSSLKIPESERMRSLLLLGDRERRRWDNHFTELEIRNTQADMVHSAAITIKLAGEEELTLALSILLLHLCKNIYHRCIYSWQFTGSGIE